MVKETLLEKSIAPTFNKPYWPSPQAASEPILPEEPTGDPWYPDPQAADKPWPITKPALDGKAGLNPDDAPVADRPILATGETKEGSPVVNKPMLPSPQAAGEPIMLKQFGEVAPAMCAGVEGTTASPGGGGAPAFNKPMWP